MVADWVWHENLRPFLEVASWLVGYSFDDLDWDAITVGLEESQRNEGQLDYVWFDYPLGDLGLRLHDSGSYSVARFELEGGDAEFERGIAVVVMVMQTYEWTKAH